MEEKNENELEGSKEFRVKELFDGSMQVEHTLKDGSTQFSNFSDKDLLIENDQGVSSVDLKNKIFNLSALKTLDVNDAVRTEKFNEGEIEIHRYYFKEDSWADLKYSNGSVISIDTNNVSMTLSEKGTKLKISAP
jgi:hypothetical protein